MARQVRTRSTAKYNEKRHKIKCASCGNPTAEPRVKSIRGVAKWICTICYNRQAARDGT